MLYVSQLLRARMKPELRKALEAELDRLSARVEAIRLLLETSEKAPTGPSAKRARAKEREKPDGRKLRWQNATLKQRKAWSDAIKAGQNRRQQREK
ncbi:hypothetical protein AUG19_03220 [archaeon 13_1_20CM_2_54_9]|nr:MAG: hypothetical protein AUG19_03220 [archaeon 13_1_20CM_2_54_9]